MKLEVRVTADDIARRECYRGTSICPIKDATNRQSLPLNIHAHINHDHILFIRSDGESAQAWLPNKAKKFIKQFDHGRPVLPFVFEIEMPLDPLAGPMDKTAKLALSMCGVNEGR